MTRLAEFIKTHESLALLSKKKLQAKLRGEGFTNKEVDEYYNPREITQVFAKPKKYGTFKITAPPYSFQLDIVFLPQYKKQNHGITSYLLLVDILSRKAFAYPLKSGSMDDIIAAYAAFVEDVDTPIVFVQGDDQFNNQAFKDFNHDMGVLVYTTVAADNHMSKGGNPLGIVDRLVRTLKGYITKYMLSHNSVKWTVWLKDIIELYNDVENSGIKNQTPNEVFDDEDYAQKLFEAQSKRNQKLKATIPLKVGDSVRAALGKGLFEKEKEKFSKEIYTIADASGFRYLIRDDSGKLMRRRFRAQDLLPVNRQVVVDRLGTGGERVSSETSSKHVSRLHKAGIVSSKAAAVALVETSNLHKEPRPMRTKKVPFAFRDER